MLAQLIEELAIIIFGGVDGVQGPKETVHSIQSVEATIDK